MFILLALGALAPAWAGAEDLCKDANVNLPAVDPYFKLKGQVKFRDGYGRMITDALEQVGTKDQYYRYSVRTPQCGSFWLYQFKKITRTTVEAGRFRYTGTLQNGVTVDMGSTLSMCMMYRSSSGSGLEGCMTILGLDGRPDQNFRYLVADPTLKEPRQVNLDPKWIEELSIF